MNTVSFYNRLQDIKISGRSSGLGGLLIGTETVCGGEIFVYCIQSEASQKSKNQHGYFQGTGGLVVLTRVSMDILFQLRSAP